MLFLPPLWFHQVHSLDEENISVDWSIVKRTTPCTNQSIKRELLLANIDNTQSIHPFLTRIILKLVTKSLHRTLRVKFKDDNIVDSAQMNFNKDDYVNLLKKELMNIPSSLISLYPAIKKLWQYKREVS